MTRIPTATMIWGGSGYVDLKSPHADQFTIADIATGLSREARFAGHTLGRHGLSVAEHSVNVANMARQLCLSEDLERVALLHDASEAYLGDLQTPAKAMPEMAGFCEVEDRLQAAIFRAFDLTDAARDWAATVRGLDHAAFAIERAALIDAAEDWRLCPPVAFGQRQMNVCSPPQARVAFLRRAAELGLAPDPARDPADLEVA